jgi:hypothetical protein
MKPVTLYAIGRLVFGAAALAAPAPAGRALPGDGGAAPDAQALLRGMGGREIGLGLGLVAVIRASCPIRPWIIAGLLADSGDITGIAGAFAAHANGKTMAWSGDGQRRRGSRRHRPGHITSRPLTSAVSTVYPPKLSDHCPLRAGQCRAVARSLLSPRRIVVNGMLAARPLRRLGCSVLMLVTTM